MSLSDWVSVLALVVESGALFLEIRRWFESGPQLAVSLTVNATIVGDADDDEEVGLLVVRVDNRGNASTTITTFAILKFESSWKRLRMQHAQSYIILHPQITGHPPAIPSELAPGQRWVGVARPRPDEIPDIESGKYYVAIYANHSDRPALKQIPKRTPDPLSDAIKLEKSSNDTDGIH
jgi:hypothetical protein